ncbi:glycosyltransferase family 4 protein [Glaciecola siphonariae]|uniref:Glycosyltransferase family 4 protein n=1 Tax=Glaciecola siphonariae TaxID=521012 RepID=A0ABV9LW13_9ALTE
MTGGRVMGNKRILLLTENFPPTSGGSGRWFWELYSRLPSEQVVVLTNEHIDGPLYDAQTSMRILRMPLSCPEWGLKSWQGLKFYIRTVWQLRRLVKQYEITEIHCGRVIHEGVSAYLLSLLSGIDYICYVHGEDVETAATSGEHNLMVKQVCKRASYLICNSQNSANIVTRLNYAPAHKLNILHPGVDCEKFVPTALDANFRAKMGWTDKRVILTVGRLQKRKGQDRMIEAMPQILSRHPDALYAVIGSGECKNELEASVKTLKLEASVQLLSEISDADMIACYQQCDLFILPNRTIDNDIEGFGMVLVEAQSCGKAVVAGDSGGTKETMRIGQSGLVVDCSDAANIADTVNTLLSDPEQLVEMGKKGREHVIQELDWRAHVEKATALFEGRQ